ncbi:hypothetical protein KP509_03G026900 [Ceratopteris richardii]|uniref:Uncharacterized protein n=1 Tax=Ceratopteris richardii TaxID=49495 RepID=A0A8T2V2D5_CERRI|nr:hypothetical protein KP509_03G026900 [Ceratopteris richardii]
METANGIGEIHTHYISLSALFFSQACTFDGTLFCACVYVCCSTLQYVLDGGFSSCVSLDSTFACLMNMQLYFLENLCGDPKFASSYSGSIDCCVVLSCVRREFCPLCTQSCGKARFYVSSNVFSKHRNVCVE